MLVLLPSTTDLWHFSNKSCLCSTPLWLSCSPSVMDIQKGHSGGVYRGRTGPQLSIQPPTTKLDSALSISKHWRGREQWVGSGYDGCDKALLIITAKSNWSYWFHKKKTRNTMFQSPMISRQNWLFTFPWGFPIESNKFLVKIKNDSTLERLLISRHTDMLLQQNPSSHAASLVK